MKIEERDLHDTYKLRSKEQVLKDYEEYKKKPVINYTFSIYG